MFEFQNLEVYKKAKVFHLESKQLIHLLQMDKNRKRSIISGIF